MTRKLSMLAADWWDYTTLDDEILDDAAKLSADDMAALSTARGSGSIWDIRIRATIY